MAFSLCYANTKVAIACYSSVQEYISRAGILALSHQYPRALSLTVVAHVNLDQVLETLSNEDLQVGAWVHVIGEVIQDPEIGSHLKIKNEDSAVIFVQAMMLWPAQEVNLDQYERAVELRKQFEI
jgi:hypothetical protein